MINSPKRIGIVLNNVIRDYVGKLKEVYEKYTGFPNLEPIDPYNLDLSFPLQYEEFADVYQWIYYGVSLEVFGGANQTQTNILSRISNFQTKINDRLIILSRETTRTKFATLSFLSKAQFDLNEIIFVDGYEDYWNYVDVLITDHPEILRAKPYGKISVVLKNAYNTEFHNSNNTSYQFEIDSIGDIFSLPIFNLKPIKPEEMVHVTGEMMAEDDVIMDAPEELIIEGAKTIKFGEAEITYVDGKPQVIDLTEIRDKIDETELMIQSDEE